MQEQVLGLSRSVGGTVSSLTVFINAALAKGVRGCFPLCTLPYFLFPYPSPHCTCCLTKVNMSAYIVLHLRRKDMQFVVVWLCCYVAWRCPFRCHPIQLPYNPFSLSLPPPSASKYSSPLGFFVAIMYAVCFVLSDVRSFVASLLFFVAPKLTTISFHLLSEVNSSVPRSFISPLPCQLCPPLLLSTSSMSCTDTHCHLIFCHFVQLLLAGLIILTASTGWMEGRWRGSPSECARL